MSRTPGCAIPRPILVLAILATICLLVDRMRTVYDECRRRNVGLTNSFYFNTTVRNIADFPVALSTPGLKLFIHRAFLDARFSKRIVRIFAMEERDGTGYDFKCKWTVNDESTGEKISQEVTAKRYWIDTTWPEWSLYFACEYDCTIPPNVNINNITLRSDDAKYSFDIKIEKFHRYDARKDLVVCVKPISGYQPTAKGIEWFETLKAVGYTDVIIYDVDTNGPGRHVVDYYAVHGLATVVKFPYLMSVVQVIDHLTKTLSPQQRYALYEQIYLIAIHDCLYRFGALFRYISFLDMNELIVPTPDESIVAMLHRAETANPLAGAFLLMTSWHWEDTLAEEAKANNIESNQKADYVRQNTEQHQNKVHLYMQQYSQGTEPIDQQPKSIISSDRVISMNLNEILDVAQKDHNSITLPYKTFGALHHFGGRCGSRFDFMTCDSMIKTRTKMPSIDRYKEQIQASADNVAQHLQLL